LKKEGEDKDIMLTKRADLYAEKPRKHALRAHFIFSCCVPERDPRVVRLCQPLVERVEQGEGRERAGERVARLERAHGGRGRPSPAPALSQGHGRALREGQAQVLGGF
jgi:hypothetical protein